MLASGLINGHTTIWRDGMDEWMPLKDVPEWQAQLATPGVALSGQLAQGALSYYPGYVPTSGLAIASMVCGIISLVTCYFGILTTIPAIICGHLAMNQINKSPVPVGGKGMAIAGLICGYVFLGLAVLAILYFTTIVMTSP